MGRAGLTGWIDGKCVLPQCYFTDLSRTGSAANLARETQRYRPAHYAHSKIGDWLRHLRDGFFRIAFTHVDYPADHLRRPVRNRVSANFDVELVFSRIAEDPVFFRSRHVQLDAATGVRGGGLRFSLH